MNWQPIKTAPKDRRILLYYHQEYLKLAVCGKWNKDEYANKPKPHWETDRFHMGKTWHRINTPSHWAELEAPE